MEKSFSTIKNITNTYQTCFDKNFDIRYPNFSNYGGLRNFGHYKKNLAILVSNHNMNLKLDSEGLGLL